MSALKIAMPALLVAFVFLGCSRTDILVDPPMAVVPIAKEGDENFYLVVSNQSSSRDPVDIAITVDGKQVVSGEFEHGYGHRHTRYLLRMEPGEHVLSARTRAGKAEREVSFSTGEGTKRWADISYFYSPGGKLGVPIEAQFEWKIQDKPIMYE